MKEKSKGILKGYKRIGKRYVPPLLLYGVNKVSYINDLLPELVWIALLNLKYGYIKSARIIERVSLSIDRVEGTGPQDYSLLSSYKSLSLEQQHEFTANLKTEEAYKLLLDAVNPLILLYDECPIRFLGVSDVVETEKEMILRMKSSVGQVISKYETPGIVLHAGLFLFNLVAKKISLGPEVDLPDLNSIIESPDSEEAQRVAAFLRSYALFKCKEIDSDSSWARYFWRRGIELSPCELPREMDYYGIF